jgi:DnaJ-class molecular chaperone
MKKPPAEPTELRCPACDGTGFPKVTKTVAPGRKIYPAPCKECNGKGRIPILGNVVASAANAMRLV